MPTNESSNAMISNSDLYGIYTKIINSGKIKNVTALRERRRQLLREIGRMNEMKEIKWHTYKCTMITRKLQNILEY